jgi:hypothetical protein
MVQNISPANGLDSGVESWSALGSPTMGWLLAAMETDLRRAAPDSQTTAPALGDRLTADRQPRRPDQSARKPNGQRQASRAARRARAATRHHMT